MSHENLSEVERLTLKRKKLDGCTSSMSACQTFAIGVDCWNMTRESARKVWDLIREMKRAISNMGPG